MLISKLKSDSFLVDRTNSLIGSCFHLGDISFLKNLLNIFLIYDFSINPLWLLRKKSHRRRNAGKEAYEA